MLIEVPSSLYAHESSCCHKLTPSLELIFYDSHEPISKYEAKLNKNIFLFILKGSKNISIKNQDITLNEGYGAFVKKDEYLMTETSHSSEQGFSSLIILVDDDKLLTLWKNAAIQNRLPNQDKQQYSDTGNWAFFKQNKYIQTSLNNLKEFTKQSRKVHFSFIEAKLQELLFYIANTDTKNELETLILTSGQDSIVHLKRFMEENYDKPWSMSEFASHLALSLSSFKRAFKHAYGCPPKTWINQKRLEKAAAEIVFKKKSLIEIALSSGFSGSSQFSRAFKKQYNCAPSNYCYPKLEDVG
ncbi:MAG: helix-turn-helix transcriptional regulator [Oleiphilus sp.]